MLEEATQDHLIAEIEALRCQVSELKAEQARLLFERTLPENEEIYRLVTESLNDIISLHDLDGKFLYISPSVLKVTALAPQEIIGKEGYGFIHPEDAGRVLTEGHLIALTGQVAQLDLRVLCKDGSYKWVETRVMLVKDAEGRPYRLLCISRDIHQRRQEAEATRQILKNVPDIVARFDREHRILYTSPAIVRATGIAPEELTGKRLEELEPDTDESSWIPLIDQVFQSGESAELEFAFDTPLGERTYHARLLPEFQSEQVATVLSIARDVTVQKQAEETRLMLERKLLETQRMESLGVLAGGIAHDFNNLLMGVLGNAELALEERYSPESVEEYLKRIEVAALRASELTRQLLTYAGKGTVQITRVRLNALVNEMIHLLRVPIATGARLEMRLADELPEVEADSAQLRQVVMNLIVNAGEALEGQEGQITVTTGVLQADRDYLAQSVGEAALPAGDYVFVEVKDTGCGMDATTLAKIFDPFFTTKFTGRGLGLAAVMGIVRGHHGALTVESEVGRGSVFRMLLPAVAPTQAETESLMEKKNAWRGVGTALIIDDEEAIRDIAQQILQRFGLTTLTANGGLHGLAALRSHGEQIDFVLLDLTMPAMSGEETLREIRVLRPALPVILMSGYTEQSAVAHLADENVQFLQKPFSLTALQECVSIALKSSASS